MPKPWCDPASGIYYANFRVPSDLISHFKKQHWQRSLRTKNEREARRLICEHWLSFQQECDRARRERTLSGSALTSDLVPHLVQEWLHLMLETDEHARLLQQHPQPDSGTWGGYSNLIDHLDDGRQSGKPPEFLLREAAWLLNEKGLRYDSRGLPFAKLLNELSPAYARYLNALQSRDRREHAPTPPKPKAALLISQLYEKFKADRIANNSWKNPVTQDKREYGPIVRDFIKVVGDKPIHTLSDDDIDAYYEHVLHNPKISLGTKKRNFYRIKALLKYAKEKHRAPELGGNLKVEAGYKATHDSYKRFEPSELIALFHSTAYRTGTFPKAAHYWVPLIGLYTGARIDEIASLLVTDIEEKQGVWCYQMSSVEANDGGKNDYAPRWVPIHPKVLEMGFLGYLRTIQLEGHRRIFPDLGNATRDGCGKRASVDFTAYRRSVGVGALKGRSNKVFHSFRSTLVSELKERGVDGELRRALVGHTNGGDVHDSIYDQSNFPAVRALHGLSQADFGLEHHPFTDTDTMKNARLRYMKE